MFSKKKNQLRSPETLPFNSLGRSHSSLGRSHSSLGRSHSSLGRSHSSSGRHAVALESAARSSLARREGTLWAVRGSTAVRNAVMVRNITGSISTFWSAGEVLEPSLDIPKTDLRKSNFQVWDIFTRIFASQILNPENIDLQCKSTLSC